MKEEKEISAFLFLVSCLFWVLCIVFASSAADTGVRVNCVTPAAVKTAIFDQMTEQHIQFMLSKIPMGRFGTPEEVAAPVAWLCTEECSFSTGAVFDLRRTLHLLILMHCGTDQELRQQFCSVLNTPRKKG